MESNFVERFWSRVERKEKDECWFWKGKVHRTGYGEIRFGRKVYKAHRVAYALGRGELALSSGERGARGVIVLHTCDNRSCCNPDHLVLGTQADNMRDACEKARMGHGGRHYL